MLKLSIVIPVYNVEQYVAKCLDSCVNQDLPLDEYEIIVVNDGTPDNSVQIVEEYMQEYSNIRIVNRENGGLSAARNTGLKEAKGEYVWFVDSDDWIEPNVLKSLIDRACKDKLDVLCFNLQLTFPDGRKQKYFVSHEEGGRIYNGKDFVCSVSMPPAAWVAFYRREFLSCHSLSFYDGILHEDQEFTPRAYYLAERISFINDIVYNYNQREGGIMKSKQNVRRCKDLLTVADSLYRFAIENVARDSEAYNEFQKKISFAFCQSLAYYDKGTMNIKEYTKKSYYPLYVSPHLDNKTKWKYRLVNFSVKLYLKVYKLIG